MFTDPKLGEFVGERRLWTVRYGLGDTAVEIVIAGDDMAPDDTLLARIKELVPRLEELQASALGYLLRESEELETLGGDGAPRLCAVTALCASRANEFVLEFAMPWDPDGVWRVEFKDGVPCGTGRDD